MRFVADISFHLTTRAFFGWLDRVPSVSPGLVTNLAIFLFTLALSGWHPLWLVLQVRFELTAKRFWVAFLCRWDTEAYVNRKYHSLLCILYERALDLQALSHLLSTYLIGAPNQIRTDTGRILSPLSLPVGLLEHIIKLSFISSTLYILYQSFDKFSIFIERRFLVV